MRLSVQKKTITVGEIFRYLGEETSLLNDGKYRTMPDILQLVIDNKVTEFVEIGTDLSRASEILTNTFHDVNVTCVNPDGLSIDKEYKNLNVVKAHSIDAVEQFNDNTFDMIYFDEHDSYDSVLNNLRIWNSKVKMGGIIAGYDHTRTMYLDVSPTVLAVEMFLRETGYIIQNTEHNSSVYWVTKK